MPGPFAGQIVTADDYTGRLDDLDGRVTLLERTNPTCRVRNYSGISSMPDDTDTVIPLEVNPYNVGGIHPGSGFVDSLTLPKTGIYAVTAEQVWDTDTNGIRRLIVRRNAVADVCVSQGEGVGGTQTPLNCSAEAYYTAGEYLQMFAYKESGSSGPTLLQAWMTVRYVRDIS